MWLEVANASDQLKRTADSSFQFLMTAFTSKQGQPAHGPLSSYNLLCLCRSHHQRHRVDTGSSWSFPQLYAALCGRAAALVGDLHAQLLALGHRVFGHNSDTPVVEGFSPEIEPLNEHTKPSYGSTPDEFEASSPSTANDTDASALEQENAVLAQLMNAVVHINERVISLEDLVFSQPIQLQLLSQHPEHEEDGDDTGSNTSCDEYCVAIADDSMAEMQPPNSGLQQEIVGELADYCGLLNGRLAQLEVCVAPSAGKSKVASSSVCGIATVSALMAVVLALNDRLCAFEDALVAR